MCDIAMPLKCQIIEGDVKAALKTIADQTVNLTVTSPPYYQHRDYGVKGQIGREKTVDGYLRRIRQVLSEIFRVTADTGSCFFVIGDTYRNKKLLLVPHRIAILADDIGWTVRNDLIWSKLDPPPESPQSRWRAAHEHILFLTRRAGNYTFNADAIRVPYAEATLKRWGNGQVYGGPKSQGRSNDSDSRMRHGQTFQLNPKGCIPTDVWSLPAGDSSIRHYATFPERLIRPIIAACSVPGDLVLDPFAGSGTTCRIAAELGRSCVGIELNPEYAKLADASLKLPTAKAAHNTPSSNGHAKTNGRLPAHSP
jgi:site-specific DNA-methyltransferase (adenine-specific)